MRLNEKLSDEETPTESYVKASIVAGLLAVSFIYIHCIDESQFDIGIPGVPSF